MMKILFIPFYKLSHQLPLLSLYKNFLSCIEGFSCSFLLPRADQKYCEYYQTNMLDFDYSPPTLSGNNNCIDKKAIPSFVKDTNEVIKKYNPDIVIEDFSFEPSVFCEQNNIQRVSIQRTGFFRTSDPLKRNPLHMHSIEKELINGRRYKVFNFKNFNFSSYDSSDPDYYIAKYNLDLNTKNIFNPKVKIIPGIESIEQLPPCLDNKSYYYSGPLLPDDIINSVVINEIAAFFNDNKDRKKVFLTTGLIEQQNTIKIFDHLIKRGYAIITTIYPPYGIDKSKIYYQPFLPLHFVSSKVDLIIHHCGSGMYHYPLIYKKPAITLGTQCYDREDIALRLEKLHLSAHTPSPFDDINYMETFIFNIDKYEKGNLWDYEKQLKIRNEIFSTIQNFDIKNILLN